MSMSCWQGDGGGVDLCVCWQGDGGGVDLCPCLLAGRRWRC